jgi:hypothetical protein
VFSFIGSYVLFAMLLNLMCSQGTTSPFYGHTFNLWPVWFIVPYGMSVLAFGYLIIYRRNVRTSPDEPAPHKVAAIKWAKKFIPFATLYFVVCLPIKFIIGASIYHDGNSVDYGQGTVFTFTSSYDDTEGLKGYNTQEYSNGANSDSEDLVTIPVVMLGGTGMTMFENVNIADTYLSAFLSYRDKSEPLMFDIFTLSYRGFSPNVGPGLYATEGNVIGDAKTVYEMVLEKYPTQRPLLLSHSLGTGPTTAILDRFGESWDESPACCALGMPFSNMEIIVGELSYYTSTLFLWLVDDWDSQSRIMNSDPLMPLEILSAGKDELIAPHHQQTMRDNSPANDITYLYNPEADHNGISNVLWTDMDAHLRFLDLCMDRVDK